MNNIIKKSPVLKNAVEFDQWYVLNGGQPVGGAEGLPEHYPCVAVMFSEILHVGIFDFVSGKEAIQYMDYVYLNDFE